jgi:hypothetical protein
MHAQNIFVGGGRRFDEIAFHGDSLFQQAIMDHPEFLRGKNVRPEI